MEHSEIGPSALHRLLACPGSHQLSRPLPPRPDTGSSVYAAEGTVAHAIVEAELREGGLLESGPQLGDVVTEDGHEITVDQDMVDGAEIMIRYCEALKRGADKIWVEQRVELGDLWDGDPPEPIFGTTDFAAYHKDARTLHVVDFKYGRIAVSPKENDQARAYAAGIVLELDEIPKWVTMSIIQPRGMDGQTIKMAMISGLDLMMWTENRLVPGVNRLYEPDPPLVSGDHCRFCPAKGVCPALHKLAQDTAKTEFPGIPASPMHMSNRELAMTLDQVHVLKMWIDEIQAEASGRVERGETLPGWKLVPKRAMRKWSDATSVSETLGNDERFFETKVKSPAQIQKIDKKTYEFLEKEGLVEKKSSGSTLAPDHDPREAVEKLTAKDDFGVVEG